MSQYFVFPFEANSATGVPKIISYQGRLANASGNLLGGSSGTTFYFKFSIHSAASGGAQIWPSSTPCTHALVVTDGVFNANIGDTSECSDALDVDFNASDTLYLQVQVATVDVPASFEILSPRQRITSSGFAINASTVSGSANNSPNVLGNLVTYSTVQAGAAMASGNIFSADVLSSFAGNFINFNFASTTRFAIDQGGRTMIGTSTPSGLSVLTVGATTTSSIPLTLKAVTGQTANLFQILDSSNNQLLTIDNSGKLGVASSSPWGLLSVNPNGVSGPAFAVGSSTATNFIVSNGGNVGIGTSSPGTLFGVNGITVYGLSGATSTNVGNQEVIQNLRVAGNFQVLGSCSGCTAAGGTVTGSGSANKVVKWNTSSDLTDSQIFDNGSVLGFGTTTVNGYADFFSRDTAASASSTILTLDHALANSGSAQAQANIGSSILFRSFNTASSTQNAASITGFLSNVTPGSEAGQLAFYTRTGGAALKEAMRIDNTGTVIIPNLTATGTTLNLTGSLSAYGASSTITNLNASTLTLGNALTVANGGTGQTSFTAGNLLYGSGTGGISTTGTSSASCTGSVSCSSFIVVGGTSPTITGNPNLTINTIGATKYIGASTTALAWSFPQGFTSNASSSITSLQYGNATGTTLNLSGSLLVNAASSTITNLNAASLTLGSALTVANGGTGQTSFTAGNLLYGSGTNGISNVATSSVTCTGSASCTAFTVVGSGGATITSNPNLIYAAIGATKYYTASSTATDNLSYSFKNGFTSNASSSIAGQFTVAGGNAAIGTTTAPYPLLTLFKAGSSAANSPQLVLSGSSTVASLPNSLNNWAIGTDLGDQGKFKIASSSAIGTNDRFVIDGAGNVGIGTTNPIGLLNVHAAAADPVTWITRGDNVPGNTVTLRLGNNDATYKNSSAYIQAIEVTGINTYHLAFGTQGSGGANPAVERMRIDQNGNVGIGTTTPFGKLSIENISPSGSTPGIQVDANGAGTPTVVGLDIKNRGGTNAPQVQFDLENTAANLFEIFGKTGSNALSNKFTINLSTGNVGIGTTGPSYGLDVFDTTNGTIRVTNNQSTNNNRGNLILGNAIANQNAQLNFSASGDNSFNIVTNYSGGTNNVITFSPGGTERVRFQQNGNVGIGTTSPAATLGIVGSTSATSGVAGILENLTLSATDGGAQFGNRFIVNVAPTVTAGTEEGTLLRTIDNTTLANTTRALEVQAFSGTNTNGVNTGILSFGKTFGVQGVTTAGAGSSLLPAGVYGETQGTSTGNGVRAYSSTITTSALDYLFQESSAFSGTGLKMNFGQGTGSFTGTFADFQVNGSSKFSVNSAGTTTISGDLSAALTGTQNLIALCHATNGLQQTPDKFVDCSGAPSDIAEWYDTESGIEAGDIVIPSSETMKFEYASGIGTVGGVQEVPLPGATTTISILEKSGMPYQSAMLGVVSTAPYQTFGEDVQKYATHPQRVALSGRVPVKVSVEGGPIAIGDRITSSSIAGIGMKATTSGMTLGIALESFDGKSSEVEPPNGGSTSPYTVGKILVFINLGYHQLDNAALTLAHYGQYASSTVSSSIPT
ncbi:hypothetical protein KGQ34_02595, partial [Patescibacteria group bacterium]|nr:hypothetical protein [Patescibacteria group bacterium]